MRSVLTMEVHERVVVKLPRRVCRVKSVAKLVLYVALMLAIVQLVTYRAIETENDVHEKGWLTCVHTLQSAFQPNGHLKYVNLLKQSETLTMLCNISFGAL